MGVKENGTLAGIHIISHRETPGLGDAIDAEKSKWDQQFSNKSLTQPADIKWKVKKDGGSFDQLTGATITPRAVVKAIHNGLLFFEKNHAKLFVTNDKVQEKMSDINNIVKQGLWSNNAALVQVLGLCPLLGVSNTIVNGLGLGIATTITLVASNVTVSIIRHWVRPEIRIPVFVLIIASIVTIIELLMEAFFYDLNRILGIFIPLIVTNCAIIARAEAFASKNTPTHSLLDGLFMGLGFTGVLVTLGALRELIGFGTLFQQAHLMFGQGAEWLTITVIENYNGYLLAILPPGAFLFLGLLVAIKNIIDNRQVKKSVVVASPALNEAAPG